MQSVILFDRLLSISDFKIVIWLCDRGVIIIYDNLSYHLLLIDRIDDEDLRGCNGILPLQSPVDLRSLLTFRIFFPRHWIRILWEKVKINTTKLARFATARRIAKTLVFSILTCVSHLKRGLFNRCREETGGV